MSVTLSSFLVVALGGCAFASHELSDNVTYARHARGYVRHTALGVEHQVLTLGAEHLDAAPDAIDWSTKGATTPIKNQLNCGGCWAVSTVEGVESSIYMKTGKLPPLLSTEELIACDRTDGGCDGGDIPSAVHYLKKKGVASAEDYPDKSLKRGHTAKCTWNKKIIAKVDGMKYALPPCDHGDCKDRDEEKLAAALAHYGPLSVCVNTGENEPGDWDKYKGGVLTKSCDAKADHVDHCVQLVGYDKKASIPYWKIRNSWGSEWGENGFIRIPYGKANACCIGCEAVYIDANVVDAELSPPEIIV